MSEQTQLFKRRLRWPVTFILILWLVYFLTLITDTDLGNWGIYSRHYTGLPGILTSPFIHANFKHLLSNSVPMLGMLTIMVMFYPRVALKSFLMIYVLTGVSVWLFGREVYHIGASGVVYGLVAFVFWSGVFRRSLKSVVLALIIIILYTPMFAGILPNQEGISWESHLLGAFVGIFTSFYYKKYLEVDEMEKKNHILDDDDSHLNKTYFLPRDIFEMTKAERKKARDQSNNWFSDTTFNY
jgi:membrane associated rhomboid family serine protease